MSAQFAWFLEFVKWFGTSLYKETPFINGFIISMKLIAILADLAIGIIIYFLAKGNRNRLIYPALYLFSPFSFYLSALWGQYDQTSFLFTLLTFLALYKRKLFLAATFFTISINLKPTSLILIPLFLWIFFKQNPKIHTILFSLLICITLVFSSIALFADKSTLLFIQNDLIPKIFFKSEFRLSTNSFNFWRILEGDMHYTQDYPFLFIPAKTWGYLAFLLLNIFAFKRLKTITLENIFTALFIVSAGSWLFVTNMLDRYFFTGIVSMLILCIYKPQLLKYWLVLSIIFWLNLFNHWWYPPSLDFLRQILMGYDWLVTKILS